MDQGIIGLLDGSNYAFGIYSLVVLLISLVLGGAIGIEREFNGHAAGLRTHILISIGSTMVGALGAYNPTWIPYLLGAAIIALGFISAGSIVQTGKEVRGITTSSTVLISGIIGLTVGLGYVLEAIILTVISLVSLIVFEIIEDKTSKRSPTVTIFVDSQAHIADDIVKIASDYGLKIYNISSKIVKYKDVDNLKVMVTFVKAPSGTIKAFADELEATINPAGIDVKVPRA